VSRQPDDNVCAAFGATGPPVPLEGGQGSSWRVDDLVVKPLDKSEEMLSWQADLLGAVQCDGFRVAHPRRALAGRLVVEGWCAWEWLAGHHEQRRWPEIIAVGERFHAALANVPRPSFIDRYTDPWAIGDRVAWGELPITAFIYVKHVPRLADALRPLEARSQLIHGDLTGNVLFADDLPPAIIDLAPYWRPTAFASAIVVVDALVWEGADEELLTAVTHVEHFDQFLIRALIYRAVTDRLFREHEPIRSDDADPFLPAVDLACRLAKSAS
jgi:uncharacterized protein (TIGR02569 family)